MHNILLLHFPRCPTRAFLTLFSYCQEISKWLLPVLASPARSVFLAASPTVRRVPASVTNCSCKDLLRFYSLFDRATEGNPEPPVRTLLGGLCDFLSELQARTQFDQNGYTLETKLRTTAEIEPDIKTASGPYWLPAILVVRTTPFIKVVL